VITAHTDVVGSLLRPPELLSARDAFAAGTLAADALRAIEDRAVDDAIALQEDAGLEVVTDGEMRRLSFQSGFVEAVEGIAGVSLDAFTWGEWRSESLGGWTVARPSELAVVARLRRRRWFAADELGYLAPRTRRIAKVTLPSPSLYASLWSPARSTAAYATVEAFLADVVDLLREEVAELVRRGARYIQIDAPHYPLLIEARWRSFYTGDGGRWLAQALALDDALMAGHPDVTFGLHLCRGNQRSRWLVSGDYEPIARPVFAGTRAQRLLLEYDDERSGSFAPLRHVPDDRMIVLGLVTTKSARRESEEELAERVGEAARVVDRERLALSPQCGFSSSLLGNTITVADERAKLACIARTARRLWG
jgi:5-methyltetrahydropteroyltriglutamate--homocysteine methyltransferase